MERELEERLQRALTENQKKVDEIVRRTADEAHRDRVAKAKEAGVSGTWPKFVAFLEKATSEMNNTTSEAEPPILMEASDVSTGIQHAAKVEITSGAPDGPAKLIFNADGSGRIEVRVSLKGYQTLIDAVDLWDIGRVKVDEILVEFFERFVASRV